jgi:hypothetical protein
MLQRGLDGFLKATLAKTIGGGGGGGMWFFGWNVQFGYGSGSVKESAREL